MTTNQTIDGVPRELLERLLNAAEWQKMDFERSDSSFKVEIASTVNELRALLDAQHAVCSNGILCQNSKCQECGGNGAYKPAAQPQGEPVACMPVERCYDVRAKMIIAFNHARQNGGDLDDALDAAYKSALRFSPYPA